MKKILTFMSIVVIAASFAGPFNARAFSECHSEKKGYCIRLGDPVSNQQKNKSALLLADTAFPGLEFLKTYGITFETAQKDGIGGILSALYNFGVAIAGVSALIMMTMGGVIWMTSESSGRISTAKSYITNAIFGLVIIATSYLILYTINPDFTFTLDLKNLKDLPGSGQQAPAQQNQPSQPNQGQVPQ